MRWFFLFVLALNLAYISWYLLSEPDHSSVKVYDDIPPLKKDIDRIVLLSEKDSAQAGASAASSKTDPVDEQTTPPLEGEQAPVQASAESEPEQPEPEQPEPDQPIKQALVASGTQAGAADSVSPAGSSGGDDEHCYTLGPFKDLKTLRSLTRDIKSYVMSADFRGEEVNEPASHWVYIRPLTSTAQAKKTTEQLKANRINDFYIIRSGDLKNGVSLGRFRNKASAYGLAKKVGKLGFDVTVDASVNSSTQYWLDYQLSADATIPKSVFDKHLGSQNDAFSRESRVCGPGV